MAKTTADILVEHLIDWGVSVIFGLPGDGINGLMEALRTRQDRVRFVQVRHEEAAAFMACGYAKYTGRLGVCLASRTRSHDAIKAARARRGGRRSVRAADARARPCGTSAPHGRIARARRAEPWTHRAHALSQQGARAFLNLGCCRFGRSGRGG
jgi:hypothetical protein